MVRPDPATPGAQVILSNKTDRGGSAEDPAALESQAASLAEREDVYAAVGLTSTAQQLAVVPAFERAGKPVLSFSATGIEAARAFADGSTLWRLKKRFSQFYTFCA